MTEQHHNPPELETQGMFPNLDHAEPTHDEHGGEHHVHVTPFWPMLGTFIALLVLTVLTVLTAKGLYLGNAANLVIALFIAGLKAVLVAAFFMHLLYDKALNTIVVVATMFATVLFISLTAIDLGTRDMASDLEEGEIVPGGGARVTFDEETGNRTVARTGEYRPWHDDDPSKNIVDISRETYKAKKAHEGKGADDDHAEHASPTDEQPHPPETPDEQTEQQSDTQRGETTEHNPDNDPDASDQPDAN